MAYPAMPPTIELAAQIAAYRQARSGLARIMGARRTSGGTGKNELSAKAMAARAKPAWRDADSLITHS
jgi:hypothetical protein